MFSETLTKEDLKAAARPIGLKIKSFAKSYVNDESKSTEETLAAFFSEVHALSGEIRDYKSSETFSVLVNNWQSSRSTRLLSATYFFLHSNEAGFAAAISVDRKVFGGRDIHEVYPHLLLPSLAYLRVATAKASPQPTLVQSWTSGSIFHFSNKTHATSGRDEELSRLKRIFEAQPGFHWVQLAGGAGQGKTTLVTDLLRVSPEHWNVGFLDQMEMRKFSSSWET